MKRIILVSLLVSASAMYAEEQVTSENVMIDSPVQDEDLSDLFDEEHTELDTVHSPEQSIAKSEAGLFSYARVAIIYLYRGHLVPAYQTITSKLSFLV